MYIPYTPSPYTPSPYTPSPYPPSPYTPSPYTPLPPFSIYPFPIHPFPVSPALSCLGHTASPPHTNPLLPVASPPSLVLCCVLHCHSPSLTPAIIHACSILISLMPTLPLWPTQNGYCGLSN